MATKAYTSGKGGKSSAAIWKENGTGPEEKLPKVATATWALTIAVGNTVKWNTTEEGVVSMVVKGSVTAEGTPAVFIGGTTSGLTALNVESGGSYKAAIQFKSTNTNREKIVLEGTFSPENTFLFSSGKYVFEGTKPIAPAGSASMSVENEADVELGSLTYEGSSISTGASTHLQSTGKINIPTSAGFGTGFRARGTNSLESATVEIAGGGTAESAAGYESPGKLGTLKVTLATGFLKVFGALNVGLLELVWGSESGLQLENGKTHKLETLKTNGTSAKKVPIRSDKAGTKAKLSLPTGGIEATGVGLYEDLEATEAAPLYVGTEAEVTNCVWVLKEAKPSAVEIKCAAAAVTSGSSLRATAKPNLEPAHAEATSASSIFLQAATEVRPANAAVSSVASLFASAATQPPLEPAKASASASLGISAATTIPLANASSSSTSSLSATAKTLIEPASAAATSSTANLPLGGTAVISLAAASSSSATTLLASAKTQVQPAAASSSVATTLAVTAATRISPAAAKATSTTLPLTVTTFVFVPAQPTPTRITISGNRARVTVTRNESQATLAKGRTRSSVISQPTQAGVKGNRGRVVVHG